MRPGRRLKEDEEAEATAARTAGEPATPQQDAVPQLLDLQRTAGNRAVGRVLAARNNTLARTPPTDAPPASAATSVRPSRRHCGQASGDRDDRLDGPGDGPRARDGLRLRPTQGTAVLVRGQRRGHPRDYKTLKEAEIGISLAQTD
jgi:hypothetical protein